MKFNLFVGLLLLSMVVSIPCAVIGWRQRKLNSAAGALCALMTGLAWWSGVYALQCASTTLKSVFFFDLLLYPGVVLIPGSFFVLAICITGGETLLTRRRLALLTIVPILTVLSDATNPFTHLFMRNTRLTTGHPPELIWSKGPLFLVHTAYSYVLLATGVLLLVRFCWRSKGSFRRHALIVLACTTVPWGANAVAIFHLWNIGWFDPTPVAFCVTGSGVSFAIFRGKFLDLLPVARDLLVETMSDAFIVLDQHSRVRDLNPAACKLFDVSDGTLQSAVLGKRVDVALGEWATPLLGDSPTQRWTAKAGSTDLDVRVTRLENRHGNTTGYLVLTRDVTDYQRAQQELSRINEVLRSQIETTEKLRSELQEQAVHDPLTGIFNRRYMDIALEEELAVARNGAIPVSVVLIDVDHFKGINDSLGHTGGDVVLVQISDLLVAAMRSGDVCCRLGGDEFLVILPGTAKDAAQRRAQQWINSCASLVPPGRKGTLGVTISAGVATAPADGTDIDTVLAAADEAMYSAKRGGRNRVTVARRD